MAQRARRRTRRKGNDGSSALEYIWLIQVRKPRGRSRRITRKFGCGLGVAGGWNPFAKESAGAPSAIASDDLATKVPQPPPAPRERWHRARDQRPPAAPGVEPTGHEAPPGRGQRPRCTRAKGARVSGTGPRATGQGHAASSPVRHAPVAPAGQAAPPRRAGSGQGAKLHPGQEHHRGAQQLPTNGPSGATAVAIDQRAKGMEPVAPHWTRGARSSHWPSCTRPPERGATGQGRQRIDQRARLHLLDALQASGQGPKGAPLRAGLGPGPRATIGWGQ